MRWHKNAEKGMLHNVVGLPLRKKGEMVMCMGLGITNIEASQLYLYCLCGWRVNKDYKISCIECECILAFLFSFSRLSLFGHQKHFLKEHTPFFKKDTALKFCILVYCTKMVNFTNAFVSMLLTFEVMAF